MIAKDICLSQRKLTRTTNIHRITMNKIIDRYESSSKIKIPIQYNNLNYEIP